MQLHALVNETAADNPAAQLLRQVRTLPPDAFSSDEEQKELDYDSLDDVAVAHGLQQGSMRSLLSRAQSRDGTAARRDRTKLPMSHDVDEDDEDDDKPFEFPDVTAAHQPDDDDDDDDDDDVDVDVDADVDDDDGDDGEDGIDDGRLPATNGGPPALDWSF